MSSCDQIYVPWVKTKADVPAKMHNDHEGLVLLLDNVKSMEAKYDAITANADNSAETIRAWTKELKVRNSLKALNWFCLMGSTKWFSPFFSNTLL